jgi:phenylacetate-coenzyme A ligase PaaK-like adenylate-forming protein
VKDTIDGIFKIKSSGDFKRLSLDIFKYQANENEVYKRYLNSLKTNIDEIKNLEQIPFLPIEFFKTHKIITGQKHSDSDLISFSSSGTTGMSQSQHFVSDISIYEKSYLKAFEIFYGDVKDYCILALLPSYIERDGSSLIYMANDLIKKSKHADSGFYLNNYEELNSKLNALLKNGQKVILLGVTYALLDFTELFSIDKSITRNLIVMETGGMKGKRKEMVREELHEILCKGFGVENIHSEYGMTELLSQAYSKGKGIFNCPPWMRILIRDTNDPFAFLPNNKTGGINVIDLANIYSCSFLATQDLGKTFSDNSFEVLGRFDNSDIRGCNLLVG